MRTAATPNCQVSYSQIDQFMINPSLATAYGIVVGH
jgi:hypothetical protein